MLEAVPPEMAGLSPFDLLDEESARVDAFYSALAAAEWLAPTRCAEWNRFQLLAHLASIEDYTRAGLDGVVTDLMSAAPSSGMDQFNAWGVEQRTELGAADLLVQWRALSAKNRRELRERGPEGEIDTAVGPYPLARQTYYLASELAIHGDDAGATTPAPQRAHRLAWRVKFARVAIAESGHGVSVRVVDGGQTVRLGDEEAFVDDATLVEAASGRLSAGTLPPSLQKALVTLA
jgi:uncharacterized protein (TIGR03083 family)